MKRLNNDSLQRDLYSILEGGVKLTPKGSDDGSYFLRWVECKDPRRETHYYYKDRESMMYDQDSISKYFINEPDPLIIPGK